MHEVGLLKCPQYVNINLIMMLKVNEVWAGLFVVVTVEWLVWEVVFCTARFCSYVY